MRHLGTRALIGTALCIALGNLAFSNSIGEPLLWPALALVAIALGSAALETLNHHSNHDLHSEAAGTLRIASSIERGQGTE